VRKTVCAATMLALGSGAFGAEIEWASPSAGLLLDGNSWVGGMTPGPNDGALFHVAGMYEVQLGVDAEMAYLEVNGSSPTFFFPGSTLSMAYFGDKPPGVVVGRSAGSTSALTLSMGEVVTDVAALGVEDGSDGTLTVTGASSLFETGFRFDIGDGGNGALAIASGGTVSSGTMLVGRQSGATGSVAIDGGGSLLDGSFLTIGEQGQGSLAISNGGGAMLLGLLVGAGNGAGDVTLDGAESFIDLGEGNAVFGDGSDATLTMSEGSVSARDIVFARSGSFTQATCTGGMFSASRNVVIGDGGSASVEFGSEHTTLCDRLRIATGNMSQATLLLNGQLSAISRVDVSIGLFSLGVLELGSEGRLAAPSIRVYPNGVLRGDGIILADLDVSGGVEPEGTLEVSGDMTLTGSLGGGTLLYVADASEDTLDLSGTATLTNGTFRLRLADGFTPSSGQEFTTLRADSIVGDFAQVILPDADWSVEVVGDEVVATYSGTSSHPADFDGDGDVDSFDLSQLLAQWGLCADCEADFDGDGDVDSFDLSQLLAAWG